MAGTPTRIQRCRTKGWKAPPDAIAITRPGLFGNPFDSAGSYRLWLQGKAYRDIEPERRQNILKALPDLKQHRFIMCWCSLHPPGLCHGDVLIELMEALG